MEAERSTCRESQESALRSLPSPDNARRDLRSKQGLCSSAATATAMVVVGPTCRERSSSSLGWSRAPAGCGVLESSSNPSHASQSASACFANSRRRVLYRHSTSATEAFSAAGIQDVVIPDFRSKPFRTKLFELTGSCRRWLHRLQVSRCRSSYKPAQSSSWDMGLISL